MCHVLRDCVPTSLIYVSGDACLHFRVKDPGSKSQPGNTGCHRSTCTLSQVRRRLSWFCELKTMPPTSTGSK